jgi:predicted MFS family arabinose efflux permease
VILRNRSLLALLVAEFVSRVGSQMTFLALPWFVLVTTHSPAKMGIVLAVELLPTALLGVPSGTLVTRLGARLTMLGADLARVPLMAALPILHAAGLLSFPLLLVLVAAFGCFNAPYFASQRVILPELLGSDERTVAQANSVLEGATQTSSLLGPPLAGVLIATLGAANVLYVDAATFALSFVTVLLFVPRRERRESIEDGGGLLAGMSFLLRDALMGPLATVIILMNALGQMLGASLPVLAFQRYDDATVAGWLFAAFGLGGLIGTAITFRLVTRVAALTLVSFAAIGFALPLWVLVPHVPLAPILAALAFSAVCQPLINAPMFGLITTRTPAALLPKVMTAIITLATVAGPLGLLAAGALLEHHGLRVTFTVIAGGVTGVALLFVGLLARFRRREVQAAAAAVTP